MSSMDRMRDASSILSEAMRKTSLRPSHFKQLRNTKSSSLMRQITQPTTYNSSYGRLLRSLVVTAGSSSPVITKTELSNHFIPVAQWLNSELGEEIDKPLPPSSSNVSNKSWIQKVLNMITRSW